MSHFTVLVVTDSPADVDAVLQPFHEYECTGIDDQYVSWVPINEDELRSDYERHGDGRDFAAFAKDWARAEIHDGKFCRYTNPNAKWDGWVIGGRWSGFLMLRDGSKADQAQWKDVDLEAMRDAKGRKAAQTFDRLAQLLDGLDLPEPWHALRTHHGDDIEAARAEWRNHPAVAALSKSEGYFALESPEWIEHYRAGRDAYVARNRRDAAKAFAILKDGQWRERGRMGWFAVVRDEKDDDTWDAEYAALLDSIHPSQWVTVVDCHI